MYHVKLQISIPIAKPGKTITIFFFNLLHDSTLALNIKQECICLSKFRHNDKIKIQEGERV